jgi:integrase
MACVKTSENELRSAFCSISSSAWRLRCIALLAGAAAAIDGGSYRCRGDCHSSAVERGLSRENAAAENCRPGSRSCGSLHRRPQSEIHQLARSLATKSGEADYSTGEGVHPRASKEGRPEDCEPRTRHAAPRLPTWLPAGPAARRSGAVLPKSARGRAAERLPEPELYHKLLLILPDELWLLLVVAYHVGLRKGALLRIKWSQVDTSASCIWIERKPEPIAVPIDGDMAKFLAIQPRESEYFFARGSKPIRDFRARWNQACEEAGVPGLLFHDLRRTAVRNLRRAGVAESVIMKITGPRTRGIFDLTTSPTKATPRKPVALPKSSLPRNTIPAWHKSRHKIGRKPN